MCGKNSQHCTVHTDTLYTAIDMKIVIKIWINKFSQNLWNWRNVTLLWLVCGIECCECNLLQLPKHILNEFFQFNYELKSGINNSPENRLMNRWRIGIFSMLLLQRKYLPISSRYETAACVLVESPTVGRVDDKHQTVADDNNTMNGGRIG